ncbi:Protein FAM115A [Fibrella aestuarina BUZ 2]|uniref:Protein FAM115A n=1 Tax=Fibrella aestuarina BUZ 2 TaxID=1166018 RepID=I0KD76_9BACT|nr:M60 family metallopeptidase [Fibrella aestuarina]CCH02079.1 Protein FAM115A [Fibrella aestuarina BUZ 2]
MKNLLRISLALSIGSGLYSCTQLGFMDHRVIPGVGLAVADQVQRFKLTPSASAVADRLQFRGTHNDMQATGYYVAPNSSVTLTVKAISGPNSARLAIGTPFRDNVRPVRQYVNLTEGTQTFTVDKYGGLVYVIYTANDYLTTGSVELTFGNGFLPVPYYRKGKNTHQQWLNALDTLKSMVPDVMFESENAIMVANMDEALKYRGENQDLIINRLDSIIDFENRISGLSGRVGVHAIPDNKHLITVRDSASGGYMAAGIAIYYTEALSYRMLQPLYLSNTNGWGLWHEVGHTYQQKAWTWSSLGETTVNVYSMAAERGFGLPKSRVTINNSWPKLDTYFKKPIADRDYNTGDNELKLIPFQQLYLAFGDNLFSKLSTKTRDTRPAITSDADKMRYFMLSVSEITQKDLSDFFRKWGFKVDESVYQAIAAMKLPAPAVDITTLRDPK